MDAQSSSTRRPVHINTATAEELQGVKGIGPVLAGRIVGYREAHGPFRELAELMGVPGIGPRLLERLAEQLTVEEVPDLAETGAAAPEPWPEVSSAAQELNVLHEAGADLAPPAAAAAPQLAPIAEAETTPAAEAATAPAGAPPKTEKEIPMAQPIPPAQKVPPQPVPVAVAPQRSFWNGLVLVLLGGLAGVLLTLAVFALLSGTLNFASRREVDALSRNVNTMQANQEITWQRLDQLTTRLERLEGTVGRLERLEPQVAALGEELKSAQTALERLGKELAAFRGETQQALKGLDERLGQAERELGTAQKRLDAVEESLGIVQERVRAFDAFFVALRDLLIALEGLPQPTAIPRVSTPTPQPTLPAPTVTPQATPTPTGTR